MRRGVELGQGVARDRRFFLKGSERVSEEAKFEQRPE